MTFGLILAAGSSSRYADGPKQLAPLHGKPLLQHVVDAARSSSVLDRVLCVLGAHACEIEEAVDFSGIELVHCDDWADGQSASLRCGLSALEPLGSATPHMSQLTAVAEAPNAVMVLLGDQPGVTPELIAGLAAQRDPLHFAAVRPLYHGRPGHPILLERPLLDRAGELNGDCGYKDLLDSVPVREWEAGSLGDPADVDTVAALAAVSAAAASRARL